GFTALYISEREVLRQQLGCFAPASIEWASAQGAHRHVGKGIRARSRNPKSSFRRMPESGLFNILDSGLRRGDEWFNVSL
ncbi:hypothetical protein ABTN00_20855, partial [Acinetobacter baumannii]